MGCKKSLYLIAFCVVISACGAGKLSTAAPLILEIETIDINADVVMETDADVNWRKYTFKNMPLTFMFTDSVAPALHYGDSFKVNLANIFFTSDNLKNTDSLSGAYSWNLQHFTAYQVRSSLTAAYKISMHQRRYVVCSFTKNELGTLPFEENINYLIDITDARNIKAIAFPDVDDDGGDNDVAEDVFLYKGYVGVKFKYYKIVRPAELVAGIIYQDKKGKWVVE